MSRQGNIDTQCCFDVSLLIFKQPLNTMKQIIILLIAVLSYTAASAQNSDKNQVLSEQDCRTLKNAIHLVNGNMAEAALVDFDNLIKRYPDNYLVQYERLYALYSLGRYADITKEAPMLLSNSKVEDTAFQLCGNAFDMMGNSEEARRIYQLGIEHFPNSGSLYLELGNLDWMRDEYASALPYYLQGIDVDPNFASNYFRAAIISFAIEEAKIWGLIYAETEILLAPNNEERHDYMAKAIRNCYVENIKCQAIGDKWEASVKLVPARNIQFDKDNGIILVDFTGVYETCVTTSITKYFSALRKEFKGSIADMTELRKGILETYMKTAGDIYGKAMYLLPFQKNVIDAGHWEAYNYFLLGPAATDEFNAWYECNSEKLDKFIKWYNQDDNRFQLGDGKSVGQLDIFSDYKSTDLMKALELQIDTSKSE